MSKSKSKKTPKNYEEAMEELQTLTQDLQSDAVSIDQLSDKVNRAKELIQYCRTKLRTTQEELGGILGE